MGNLLGGEEIVEISPHFRIMWGSAVHHASVQAEEYLAAAEIAKGKVDLARSTLAKARIGEEWAKWNKNKHFNAVTLLSDFLVNVTWVNKVYEHMNNSICASQFCTNRTRSSWWRDSNVTQDQASR